MNPSITSLPVFAFALAITILASGCAVPLGAGFRLRSRQLSFSEVPPAAAPLHLRINDHLENTGNRPLDYLDVSTPPAPARTNFTVRIDNKPVEAAPLSDDPGAPLRVHFLPPWPPAVSHEIAFEYDLSTEPVRGGVAGMTSAGFYLADPRALPVWLTPVGAFSSSRLLDRDERMEITAPSDFRVITSEKRVRRRMANGKFTYSFRASGKDIPAFVVAGHYVERIVQTQHGDLALWSFHDVDPKTVQTAAERLRYTVAIFTRLFGPPPEAGPFRVVEAPEGLFARNESGQINIAASFPSGVLLSSRAFEEGLASEPVMRAAEAELVKAWFGWRIPLRLDAEILLGRGLGLFAIAMAAEGRGGPQARRAEIERLLAIYDRVRLPDYTESLLQSPDESTRQQLAANSYKCALFLAALDDLAGEDKFERALRRLQYAMAGRGIYLYLDDLRAAVEGAIGKPVPEFFRQWLNNPGIPEDFRARYSDTGAPIVGQNIGILTAPADESLVGRGFSRDFK